MRSTGWLSSIEIGRRQGTAQAMDERASGSPYAHTCGSFASDSGRSPVVRRMSQADPKLPFASLFDDLFGAGEDRWWDGQAECLRGLEIDDERKCCRLLDREIGRFGALQNPSRVNTDLTKKSCVVRS